MNFHSILKSLPFVILVKSVPDNPFNYNLNTDYCYYWFNVMFDKLSGFSRKILCAGSNGKIHFPRNHRSCFKDNPGNKIIKIIIS